MKETLEKRPSTPPTRKLAAAIAVAAALLCRPELARAQALMTDELAPDESASAPESMPATLQQVVVSARRQRENPQNVPMSISAFSEDSLLRADVRMVTDLEKYVPGLSICCSRGQSSFSFVRGIQGLQAYFAETPILGTNGTASSLNGSAMYFDLDNVAVLKGPQGTLFGMSTNGGTVLFAPNRPTSALEGHVSGEFGNYGRRIFQAVVNLPLSEMLKLRVGVQSARVDGFVTDVATGNRLGNDDYTVSRVALSFRPTASFDSELYLNDYRSHGRLPPYVPVAVNPLGPAQAIPGVEAFIARQRQLGYYRLVGTSLPGAIENTNEVRRTQLASITTLRLGENARLKNIIGYSRDQSHWAFDADATPFKIYDDGVPGSTPGGAQQLVSEELQLQGKLAGGGLGYTVGLFLARSYPGRAGNSIADLSDVAGSLLATSASARFRTRALYAQASHEFGDALAGVTLTAGYRFTVDRRWLAQTGAVILPGAELSLPYAPLDLKSENRNGSYTLGLSYQATPTTMIYFNNSKGFLNGGFNTSVTQARDAPYGPEALNNFEVGLKSDFVLAGIRARANLAAYYGLYTDGQVSVTSVINEGTPEQAFAVLTKNAARGKIRGLEWNVQLMPNSGTQLQFFGAWMKNRYTRFASLNAQGLPVDLSATPFVYAPRLKYGLRATAAITIGQGRGELEATASFTHQNGIVTTATPDPQWYDRGPGFNNLDLSLHWERVMGRKGLSATFFVNNATANKDANGGFGVYESLGILGYTPATPRMFGLRFSQAF